MERTKCEIWSRAVGYLRPVEQWNVGKQEEFKDRVNYKVGSKHDNGEGERSINRDGDAGGRV